MREIKYRLWSIHSKKMFGCERNFYLSLDGDIFRSDDLDYMNKSSFEVMQYTGLKDKNGKEIYEGDVVKWTKITYTDCSLEEIEREEGLIVSVFWVETMWALKGENGNGYLLQPYWVDSNTFEVIGNIYENPELIKD